MCKMTQFDWISHLSCTLVFVYQTPVPLHSRGAVLKLHMYTCTPPSNLMAAENSLESVDIMDIFYWLKNSRKDGWEVEFHQLIPTIFLLFSPLVVLTMHVQIGGLFF